MENWDEEALLLHSKKFTVGWVLIAIFPFQLMTRDPLMLSCDVIYYFSGNLRVLYHRLY